MSSTETANSKDIPHSTTKADECPCSELGSIEAIWDAVQSDNNDQYRRMLDWLSSSNDAVTCSRGCACNVRRVMASFQILKEIRAACKPFLESGGGRSNDDSPRSNSNSHNFASPLQTKKRAPLQTQQPKPKPSYDDQFPTLGGGPPDKLKPKNQDKQPVQNTFNSIPKQKQGKKKKRIRPVAAVAPTTKSSGVWGEIAKQAPQPTALTAAFSSTKKPGAWGGTTTNNVTAQKSETSLSAGTWGKNTTATLPQDKEATTQKSQQPLSMHNDNHHESNGAKGWPNIAANAKLPQPGPATQSKGNGVETQPNPPTPTQNLPPAVTPSTPIQQAPTTSTNNASTIITPSQPVTRKDLLDDRIMGSTPISTSEKNAPKQVSFSPEVSTAQTPTQSVQSSLLDNNAQRTLVEPASNDQVDRFVEIYCTLILHNLVPSTALEFHLLLRLLHINKNKSNDHSQKDASLAGGEILAPVFLNEIKIRMFAIKALTRLSPLLRIFGVGFLKDLVKSTTFRFYMPDLTKELEQVIHDEQSSDSILEPTSLFSAVGQTALLTLPFRHERDSRHHFKSRDELAIYKNREENRDAFLYQLRSFLNLKEKLLDTVQAQQRSMAKIKSNFRVVLSGIMNVNMPWFAQFFCELLLQVGLVPLEETDKDLLNIAGKETLQKLHKRFSSKVGGTQSTKTSSKLTTVASKRQATSSLSPEEQAKELFPGHQEFFFLFVVSSDSYKFNNHLRNQLVYLIRHKQQQINDDNCRSESIEENILKTRMLSKFLGVLVFSPCWYEVNGNTSVLKKGNDAPVPDGLQQLEDDTTAGLDLVCLVKTAHAEGNLSVVIPWVTELLKMASWDESIRTRSKSYTVLISLLGQLHEELKSSLQQYIRQKRKTPSFLVAAWCLETFFGEHVGLTDIASFPHTLEIPSPTVHSDKEGEAESLDVSPLVFSAATLLAVNPQLEELISLVAHLACDDSIRASTRSPGISRKLRPLMVKSDLAPTDSKAIDAATAANDIPVEKSLNVTKSDIPTSTMTTKPGNNSIQAKMADAFFHQHKALKDICEFSVHRILKSVLNAIPERLAENSRKYASPGSDCVGPTAALDHGLKFLRTSLQEKVEQSLLLLEPPNTPLKVHQMAVSLAIARGYESGAPHVEEIIIGQDLDSIQRSLFGGASDDGSGGQEPKADDKSVLATQLDVLTCKLNELKSKMTAGFTESAFDGILEHLQSLEPMVGDWSNSTNPRIPPEPQLRDHFEAIAELDRHSPRFVDFCLSQPPPASDVEIDASKRWASLACFLRIASGLSKHPRRGFARVQRNLWELDTLEDLVRFGVENCTRSDVSELLAKMVQHTLLSEKRLEDVLSWAKEHGHGEITDVVTDALKVVYES